MAASMKVQCFVSFLKKVPITRNLRCFCTSHTTNNENASAHKHKTTHFGFENIPEEDKEQRGK